MIKRKKTKLGEKIVFPGVDDNIPKIETYADSIKAMARGFEDYAFQMSLMVTAGKKMTDDLKECTKHFKEDNRNKLVDCLDILSTVQQQIDSGHEEMSQKMQKRVSTSLTHFTNTEIKDAKESTQVYEKVRVELESNQDSIKKTNKGRKNVPLPLQTLEEQHRHVGAKTAALLVDTLDLSEMLLVESSLKYMKLYKKFLESSLRTFQEVTLQMEELERYVDHKRDTYEKGDNTKNFTRNTNSKVFGVKLEELVEREDHKIPQFIELAVDFLRKNDAKNIVGIFRISGQKDEMEGIVKAANRFGVIDFAHFKNESAVHNVSGLLKWWLRDLPVSLIPWDFYDIVCTINNTKHQEFKNQLIRELVSDLPTAHRMTFQLIIEFLSEIETNSVVNKMDALNLATVVAPNMMFPPISDSDPILFLSQSAQVNFIISYMIANLKTILPDNTPLKSPEPQKKDIPKKAKSKRISNRVSEVEIKPTTRHKKKTSDVSRDSSVIQHRNPSYQGIERLGSDESISTGSTTDRPPESLRGRRRNKRRERPRSQPRLGPRLNRTLSEGSLLPQKGTEGEFLNLSVNLSVNVLPSLETSPSSSLLPL